jgi:hypothetical protein
LGHNLSDDNSCTSVLTQPGDLNNTPAGLSPNGLYNNGGKTPSIALLTGSPARDAVPLSPTSYCTAIDGVTPIANDQRGVARPQGAACDIGAFEFTAGSTPTGTNVITQPVDTATGSTQVTLTFANVTVPGSTSLTTTETGTPPPTGFKLGVPPVYYNLSTTSVFSGPVTLCVNYTGTSFTNPSQLRLFHNESGTWIDVTTSVDTATMTICGTVTSFSPFAVLEPSGYSATVAPPIHADGSSVFNANRGVVPVKFTLSVNGSPTCALPPATISLIRTAGVAQGTVNESSFTTPSDTGTSFRIDNAACQYVYNLDAGSLGVGTYVARITIGPAVVGSAAFNLK